MGAGWGFRMGGGAAARWRVGRPRPEGPTSSLPAPPSRLRRATSPSKLGGGLGAASVLPELASGRGTARRVVEGQGAVGAAGLGGAEQQAPRPSVTRLLPRATSPFRGKTSSGSVHPRAVARRGDCGKGGGMTRTALARCLPLAALLSAAPAGAQLRVDANQLGYLPDAAKTAVVEVGGPAGAAPLACCVRRRRRCAAPGAIRPTIM